MNKTSGSQNDFKDFLKVWEGSTKSDTVLNVSALLEQYRTIRELDWPIPSVVYVWDIQNMQYLFFSENVLNYTGYSAEQLIARGPKLAYHIIHPEDVNPLLEINQKIIRFVRELPDGTHRNYKFSFNVRIKKGGRTDTYIYLLIEDMVWEVDTKKAPLLSIGSVSDISYIKQRKPPSFSVLQLKTDVPVENKYLYGTEKELLSPRELEVLALLVDGKTTSEIADVLYISAHTVTNHRKNMLKKTACNNTPALIRYAYDNGLV